MRKYPINVELLEKFMNDNKLTKGEFCKKCDISKSTLQKILYGDTEPRLRTMLKLRKGTKISLDDLVIKKPQIKT